MTDDPRAIALLPYSALPKTWGRVKKRGHAGQPGNGPEGETCRSCKFYTRIRRAKVYRKCRLNEKNWTHGAGTDIRASDPACEFWEKRP